MTQRTGRARPRLPWALLVLPAVAGVPAGILWWLLAPGGLNLITRDPVLGDGAHPQVWFPRDLTLAGLLVFAGCLLAVFLADKKRQDPQADLLMGLAGGLCGAVLAWQTGVLSARLFGPAVDATANASIAFSLRAWPVLLLWPAATAVSVFVLELMHLLGRKDDGGAEEARHPAVGPVK
jgi:peptidoglycan/LPS O-acetylase OafA/YrhL